MEGNKKGMELLTKINAAQIELSCMQGVLSELVKILVQDKTDREKTALEVAQADHDEMVQRATVGKIDG